MWSSHNYEQQYSTNKIMYISFGGRTYSFLLGIYSGVKFLGHKVGNCQTVFKSDSIILHPYQKYVRVPIVHTWYLSFKI